MEWLFFMSVIRLANVGREDFAQERSDVQCAGGPGLTDGREPCICPPYDEFHRKMSKINDRPI